LHGIFLSVVRFRDVRSLISSAVNDLPMNKAKD
jgi:hypothetical protein